MDRQTIMVRGYFIHILSGIIYEYVVNGRNGIVYDVIYLTAIGLTPGGSSTVHITHKQYTEQHNETEYTERHIHDYKNT
jgi:CRISPR/Cas system-associated protein endoribonuclease Cas2